MLLKTESIPEELKKLPQWCVWDLQNGTKIPYTPGGNKAKSTDTATWSNYEEVNRAFLEGNYKGLGFFLSEQDNLVGIDLDKCVSEEKIELWALEIVEEISSYTELSPSGKGLRILVKGKKPGKRCRTKDFPGFEIYERARFLTITGNVVANHTDIIENQEAIDSVYTRVFGSKKAEISLKSNTTGRPKLSDKEILNLLGGDNNWLPLKNAHSNTHLLSQKYPAVAGENPFDWSAADAAACSKISFYSGDGEQILRIWSQTDLADREKFNRKDYQERTINFALENCKNHFNPPSSFCADNPTVTSFISTEPQDITEPQGTSKDFPIEVFPDPFKEHCLAVSESLSCPLDMPAHAALVCAAAMCGKSYIQIKEDWREGSNLFGGIVAETGSAKTPAINAIAEVSVFRLEKELSEQNKINRCEYAREKILYQKRLSRWKRRSDENENPPEEPEEPVEKAIHVNDTTTEALAECLACNPEGLLLIQDELTGFVKGLNQYKEGGKGADRENYLSIWSMAPAKIQRKGREDVVIEAPRLCILGGVVPGNIGLFLEGEDGFGPRHLLVYPQKVPRVFSEKAVSQELKERAWQSYIRLRTPALINLTEEAKALFAEHYNNLFAEEQTGYQPKLATMTARIALILTKMWQKNECDSEIMSRAIKLISYYKSNMERLQAEAGSSQETYQANSVWKYLNKKEKKSGSLRDFVMNGVPGCKNAANARKVCQELVDQDRAMWTDDKCRRIEIV